MGEARGRTIGDINSVSLAAPAEKRNANYSSAPVESRGLSSTVALPLRHFAFAQSAPKEKLIGVDLESRWKPTPNL